MKMLLPPALLVLLCVLPYGGSQDSLSLQEAAGAVSEALLALFLNDTAFHELQESYTSLSMRGEVSPVEGKSLVQEVAEEIAGDFNDIERVLKETALEVERLYRANSGRGCCSKVCLRGDSFNRSACDVVCNPDSVEERLMYSYYRTEDNALGFSSNVSGIIIPVEVSDNDPTLLCFVEWTDNLTSQFLDNDMQLGRKVSFQFFSSTSGLVRFYPDRDLSTLRLCYRCPFPPADTFDATRRPWFVDTFPGNKFVVVLLDMSGSMTGFRSRLARLAATELLNSLNQNDFFFIIRVGSGNSTGPLGCFRSKVRASSENVLAMNHVIMNTHDTRGQADFGRAVDLALTTLANSSECHNTIIIFSDGDSETPVPLEPFQTRNANKEVRVFTYLVGLGSDGGNLRKVACQNRGLMRRIQEYDDITREISLFTDALRSQTPPSLSLQVFWNTYSNSFAMGGLVLTGSVPVVVSDNNGTSEFIGVLGMDIPPRAVKSRIRAQNLGPEGYGFVVDNNGQLLVHPSIEQTLSHVISLDVSNFEHAFNESEFDPVRQALIDREEGEQSLVAWIPVHREQLYLLKNVSYFYSPIEDTPFSVAVALPSGGVDVFSYPNVTAAMLEELGEEIRGEIAIATRPYCDAEFQIDPRNLVTELMDVAVNRSLADCDPALYQPLLTDLYLSNQVVSQWEESAGMEHVEGVFVQFASGLTHCVLSNELEVNCSDLSYLRVTEDARNTVTLYHDSSSTSPLVALRALVFGNASAAAAAAAGVVGVFYSSSLLSQLLENITMETNDTMANTTLYLVDSGGFIVGTTGNQAEVGQSLNYTHPELASRLVAEGELTMATIRGYELRPCSVTIAECVDSTAFSVYQGLLVTAAGWVGWVLDGTLWNAVKLAFLSILSNIQSYTEVGGASPLTPDPCPIIDLCLRQTAAYQLSGGEGEGTVECREEEEEEMEFSYQTVPVPDTNLLLLSVRGDVCGVRGVHPPTLSPLPCLCDCRDCERYRRPLEEPCYDNNTTITYCSSATHSDPKRLSILTVSLSISILTMWNTLANCL